MYVARREVPGENWWSPGPGQKVIHCLRRDISSMPCDFRMVFWGDVAQTVFFRIGSRRLHLDKENSPATISRTKRRTCRDSVRYTGDMLLEEIFLWVIRASLTPRTKVSYCFLYELETQPCGFSSVTWRAVGQTVFSKLEVVESISIMKIHLL